MTLLYLIRHGRTTWNEDGRMQGWADPPLDELGREQARRLAQRLRGERFAAIYASPLQRARVTAEILAEPHAQRVRLDDRLRERNLGEWVGLTFEQARARNPDRAAGDWRLLGPPGGEAQGVLMDRVSAAIGALVAAHREGTVAIVSHGGSLSAYLCRLLGVPPERPVSFSFPNTALALVSLRGDSVRVLSVGDARHLDGL